MAGSPARFALKAGTNIGERNGNRPEPRGAFVYPSAPIVNDVAPSGTTGRFFGVLVRTRLDVPQAGSAIRHWLKIVERNHCRAKPVDELVSESQGYGQGQRYSAFYEVSGLPDDVMVCMAHSAVAEHTPTVNPVTPRTAVGSGDVTQRTVQAEISARNYSPVRKVDAMPGAESRLMWLVERADNGKLSQEQAQELADLLVYLDREATARKAERKASKGTGRARIMRSGRVLSSSEATARKAEQETIARIGVEEFKRRHAIMSESLQ